MMDKPEGTRTRKYLKLHNAKEHFKWCRDLHEAFRYGITSSWLCRCKTMKEYRKLVRNP